MHARRKARTPNPRRAPPPEARAPACTPILRPAPAPIFPSAGGTWPPVLKRMHHSIQYEDHQSMKAHSIPQHHMKVFLDSLSSQGPEEVQQFVHSPISVYQQGNHYIYMGSTDVSGPLLELVHPVTSPLQHPALSYCGPLEQQHIQVYHTQSQQGHQIEMQQNHLVKQVQLQIEAQPSPEGQFNTPTSERERRLSCISQPMKKRKIDMPLEDNYSNSQSSLQNIPITVLTMPSHTQQQAYNSLQQELLTVDGNQLYGLAPATGTNGHLPDVESWAVCPPRAICPEAQNMVNTPVYRDACGIIQIGEMAMNMTSIKLEESKDNFQAVSEARKSIQESPIPSTPCFPVQCVNKNGNTHLPLAVQSGKRMYQSAEYWDEQQVQDSQSLPHLQIQTDLHHPFKLKPEEGANFWKSWAQIKNEDVWKDAGKNPQGFGRRKPMTFREDVLSVPIAELNYGLCLMTKEARKQDGSSYEADMLYYLFLCIQKYMFDNDRIDNIFADLYYVKFLERLHGVMKGWCPRVSPSGYVLSSCIMEEMLWDCKQLGAHSPATLLFTLMYFNTKYFILKTVEQHAQLAFSKILKQTRKNTGIGKDKCSIIRFLRLYGQILGGRKDETYVEQPENPDNPLQCPIKLYDFYCFKCPQGVKGPSDAFYLVPEPVVAPNSPIWYSAQPVKVDVMEQMLTRILVVKEVQEAHAKTHISA
ncbi:transcriptional regulator QRICH1-like isoform X1 [Dermochelys coriacea]|uniref:transcriptional regulator QRICH1-like isoform X1 n=2 Tax=Dermochelys coriacea TaxID=27794 RepID=UPI0018E84D7C|nr:transcriptional regulator QRICH1-like isoform X1 [Dermochelys coriacea]